MHIAQLAKRFVKHDWGGAETVILETGKRLLGLKHQTEVYCTLASSHLRKEVLGGLQVNRFPYFYPYIGLTEEMREALDRKGGSPFSFALMKALLRAPTLDLVHLHTSNRLGGIGRYVARRRRIPYVVSLHGGMFDVPREEQSNWKSLRKGTLDLGKPLGWWVGSRQVLSDAGAVLCVGYPESKLAQEQMPGQRVEYLPNGVDPVRFAVGDGACFRAKHSIPQHAYVVLTVGRIDSQKNQLLPVNMFNELRSIRSDVYLVLIGPVTNQGYFEQVKKAVSDSGHDTNVTIIPGLPVGSADLVNAYHAANVFLLPSIHEPFGIVILEAWSAGLPVVASKVGGIPHFVQHDVDGYLFDPSDDRGFLEVMKSVMTNSDRSENIARCGKQKVLREYTWDAVTESLMGIYEEVVNEDSLRK